MLSGSGQKKNGNNSRTLSDGTKGPVTVTSSTLDSRPEIGRRPTTPFFWFFSCLTAARRLCLLQHFVVPPLTCLKEQVKRLVNRGTCAICSDARCRCCGGSGMKGEILSRMRPEIAYFGVEVPWRIVVLRFDIGVLRLRRRQLNMEDDCVVCH